MSILDDIHTEEQGKKSSSSLARRLVADPLVSAAKGVVGTGQSVIGMADIPSNGIVGRAFDAVGYNAERTNQFLEGLYSPEQQAANQAVQNADGFTETLGAVVTNPSVIPHKVIESAPLMVGGQAIAKGAMLANTSLSPLVAAAIGEGAITAGSQAEQIRAESPDKLLTPEQSAIALGSGALTGLITGGSGVIANRFGGDVDRLFLAEQQAGQSANPFVRALGGGLTEGGEELLQSGQEQAATNIATGKPMEQGVGSASALGMVTGFAQGAPTAAFFGGKEQQVQAQDLPQALAVETQQALPDSPLSRAVSQLPQPAVQPVTPIQQALPELPTDEIITFNDGSQAKRSEIKQDLLDNGYDEQTADSIVNNLLATQSKPQAQVESEQAEQSQADKNQSFANDFINRAMASQDNNANTKGLTQEQSVNELLAQSQRKAQPVVFANDQGFVFGSKTEAASFARKESIADTHTPTQAYDGAWILKRNDFNEPITARNIKNFLPSAENKTASDIQQGFNALANGANAAADNQLASNIQQGDLTKNTLTKPESIKAAKANANYHVVDNPDGTAVIVGIKQNDSWIGKQPAISENTPERNLSAPELTGSAKAQRQGSPAIGLDSAVNNKPLTNNVSKEAQVDTAEPVNLNGEFPVPDSAKPTEASVNQKAKVGIREEDDLLTAIAKLGGINRNESQAQGIDNAAMNQRVKVFGKSNAFTKQGRSYDDLAESLRDYGYDITDANDLVDKVARAINQNEKIYTPRGYELDAERQLAQEAEDRFYREEEDSATKPSVATSEAELSHDEDLLKLFEQPKVDKFSSWFKQSWFTQDNTHNNKSKGMPTSFYHATNAEDLTIFDKSKLGSNTKTHATSGLGFFFSKNKGDVSRFGKNVLEVHLSAQNPLVTNSYDLPTFDSLEEAKQYSQALQDKGYDGIYLKDAGYAVVFNSNQAKLTSNVEPTDSPDIRYSLRARNKATAAATVFSPNAVKVISTRLFNRLGLDKSGKLSLVVHNTEASLPKPIQEQIERDNAQGQIRGVFYDSTIHLITSNVRSEQEIEELLLHEAMGHYGLRSLFGKDIDTALKRLFIKMGGDNGIKQLAKRHGINLTSYFELAKGKTPQYQAMMLTDELLAHLQGAKTYQSLSDKVKTALKEFWGAMRAIFKRYGFKSFQDFTDSDLAYLLKRMAQSAKTGMPTGSFDESSRDVRYSLRQDITDFFTGEQRSPTNLADIDAMLSTGKPVQNKLDWQYWADKVVTNFVDSTRPWERFISDTFSDEQASRLVGATDRASGMKAAYEREAMNLFGRDIAKGIKAIVKATNMEYQTAKNLAGFWLSARYAPIANDWLMQKDKQAIADLDQEKLDLTARFNKIRNPSQQTVDKYYKDVAALDKQIAQAKDLQAKRIKAINDANVVDITQTNSEAGLAGGFNNATAKEYMARIEAKIPKQLLEQLAEPIYDMNAWKLKRDIENGKVSQEAADKFPKSRFYVPLTGDPRTDESVEDVFSVGSVNQGKDKALGGRTTSIAQNGIDASFEQLEKSARYHGWNEFKDELAAIYNGLIAEKMQSGMTRKEAEKAILDSHSLSRRPENAIPAGENDIVVRKDGKGIIYTVHNQAAMEALRSVNNEAVPSVLKPIAFLTRLQARMVTQFMLGFAPVNMLRDTAERSENIRTRKIAGYPNLDMNSVANQAIGRAGKLLFNIKPVMMGVLAENTPLAKLFKVDNNDADVKQLKRFLELGGSSTYGDVLSTDSKGLSDKLRKSGRIDAKAMEAIELYNNAFETISGFAIYQSLVDHGVDEKKAATTSLNLMNFRKRGKVMSPIRALYMFAGPIATGGQQLAKTLATPRGRARFAAYTIASAFLYAILRSGEDDDYLGVNKMDEAGNFSLYRNILIPLGDGKYAKVPVGFGMQQLAWAQGVNMVRTSLGQMTVPEAIGESVALGTRTVMPIAPSETAMLKNPSVWFAQTFTPQIAKPIVNVALDVNAFGAPLTNARYEREDKAKSLQGRRDTPQMYKLIAQELAQASNGAIDMYPEQIREFMRDYGAGMGNEVLKWAIENPAKEQRGLKTVSPTIDRYVMQTNDDSLKQRLYYRKRDLMNELAVKQSVGNKLTTAEQKLVDINEILKKREAKARGFLAASSKAEKKGAIEKAKIFRNRYEKERLNYVDFALKQI